MIRVLLPTHLRNLAGLDGETGFEIVGQASQGAVIDAIEARHPELRGTIRDPRTQRRRPLVRFFACGMDLSDESPDAPLPQAVVAGKEPFLIVGAIAGG